MEDRFIKYSRLYALIFLLFLSVPVIFGLLVATMYGFSKLISSQPVDIIFELLVVVMPPAIIGTATFIFLKRTNRYPVKWVKIISTILFIVLLLGCGAIMVLDIIGFFSKRGQVITDYRSFGLVFLAGSIATLFLVAILQALNFPREMDYMEKRHLEKTPLI